jgi:hypothetical protein
MIFTTMSTSAWHLIDLRFKVCCHISRLFSHSHTPARSPVTSSIKSSTRDVLDLIDTKEKRSDISGSQFSQRDGQYLQMVRCHPPIPCTCPFRAILGSTLGRHKVSRPSILEPTIQISEAHIRPEHSRKVGSRREAGIRWLLRKVREVQFH